MTSFVLASASPRRTDLLHMLGIDHEVLPTHIPEVLRPGETAEAHVERLAREKASKGAEERPGALVLAGDTVVVLDGAVLGKPTSIEEAEAVLLRLSGRTHTVFTALALADGGGRVHSLVDRTRVTFRPFDRAVARAYIRTGEPFDKAGSYGIQGRGAALVSGIEGDYHTVVGLPVHGLVTLLERAGWHYTFSGIEPLASVGKGSPSPPSIPHGESR